MTTSNDGLPPASRVITGYFLIWLAAALWASLGPIYKLLMGLGLLPLTVVTFRAGLAALFLAGWTLVRERSLAPLRIARRDWPLMLAYGAVGIAFFYAVYVYAVQLTGVAVAVVLMYTAPAWVALIAWRWLGEGMDRSRVAALLLAFVGCMLVAQVNDLASLRLNGAGVLCGLGAGLGYGLYSVFNKVASSRYAPITVQFYGFAIGAIFLASSQPLTSTLAPTQTSGLAPFRSPLLLGEIVLMAIGPTLGGGLAYAAGVQRLPVSVASLLATLEPALATLFGYLLFGEVLQPGQWIGTCLILAAVVLLRPQAARANHKPENTVTAQTAQ
jgi:DME family drug/metabolite transporter